MEEVHLAILLLTAVGIVWADHLGFQYFRGQRETLPASLVKRLHYAVLVGLVGMIATGAVMAYDRFGYLSTQPVFWLKMGCVAVLVVNSFFIGSLMRIASEKPFVTLSRTERMRLVVSGGLSALSWATAATIGLFFL